METARFALIFLVCVCLWKTSCASSIQLCTDSTTSFVNGTTIPAMVGQPVSVVFCVQCDPRLYINQYIKIQHAHHPTINNYYYTNNKDVDKSIIVNITPSVNTDKATINITIKTVHEKDFKGQFSVKINTNKSLSDNSIFAFQLSDASRSGTTTSETSLIPSTQPKTPAIISIRTSPSATSTELSTASSRASTASTSTSTVGPTQDTKQCWPQHTPLCPANWYQVDNDTCLLVISEPRNVPPDRQCSEKYSSRSVNNNTIINLRSCLIKILGESKRQYSKYVVRVDNTTYVNVRSGADVTDKGTYSVVCTSGTLNRPTTTASGVSSVIQQTTRLLIQTPIVATALMSTQVVPQCIPVQTSSCPQGWYEVHNDKCLISIKVPHSSYQPFDTNLCPEHSGNPVLKDNIIMFMECLKHILQQSEPKPINYEVRLGNSAFVNVLTRVSTSDGWVYKHNVACFQKKEYFTAPVITWFTLQQWDDQRETILWQRNLLDHNNTSVTIPATNNTLNVTCRASGYPKPEVKILRDNEKLVMSPDGISLQLNHTFSGELICHATNVHKLGSTHVSVLVSTRDSTPGNTSELQEVTWNIWILVGVLTVLPTIFAVVLVCVFCKKKERRVYDDGIHEDTEYGDHQEVNREHRSRDVIRAQVEIPMVETRTDTSTTPGEYMNIVDTGYGSQSTSQ